MDALGELEWAIGVGVRGMKVIPWLLMVLLLMMVFARWCGECGGVKADVGKHGSCMFNGDFKGVAIVGP